MKEPSPLMTHTGKVVIMLSMGFSCEVATQQFYVLSTFYMCLSEGS